jgi:hypothetical protein
MNLCPNPADARVTISLFPERKMLLFVFVLLLVVESEVANRQTRLIPNFVFGKCL